MHLKINWKNSSRPAWPNSNPLKITLYVLIPLTRPDRFAMSMVKGQQRDEWWRVYYGTDSPSLLVLLNSSPCHCHSRFITKTLSTTKKSNTLSYSYTSSSMDYTPQGYRRNVGVCLINPYKKVCYYLSLSSVHGFLYVYVLLNWLACFSFLVLHWGVVIWLLLRLSFCVCLLRNYTIFYE